MYRKTWLMTMTLLAATFVAGCGSDAQTTKSAERTQDTLSSPINEAFLCGKCGQIKGSDQCCKPGQTLCAKCELAKGSPGCCLLPKGTTEDVQLCTKCGFLKGSQECCKIDGKQKCSSCGLIKGSPGCCKIQ